MKQKVSKDWETYEKYKKKYKKAFKDANPLLIITFDSWLTEILPELTFDQKAKVMILAHEIYTKQFNGD